MLHILRDVIVQVWGVLPGSVTYPSRAGVIQYTIWSLEGVFRLFLHPWGCLMPSGAWSRLISHQARQGRLPSALSSCSQSWAHTLFLLSCVHGAPGLLYLTFCCMPFGSVFLLHWIWWWVSGTTSIFGGEEVHSLLCLSPWFLWLHVLALQCMCGAQLVYVCLLWSPVLQACSLVSFWLSSSWPFEVGSWCFLAHDCCYL